MRRYAARQGRRFWAGAAAAAVATVGAYYAAHFGIAHRSRCPEVAATPAPDSGARPTGAGFTTRVAVRAHQSGFKKLFGPPRPPVTAQFTERAAGPATRRHETIDLDGLAPGWYALDVAVTDSAGRRRVEARDFQIKK